MFGLKYGEESTRIAQDFQTTMKVVSYALGGKPSDDVKPTESFDEAAAAFSTIFGRSGGNG